MKTKVNILSCIILAMLLLNCCVGLFYIGCGFYDGFRMGMESVEAGRPAALEFSPVVLDFMPGSLSERPEVIVNSVTGKPVAIQATQAIVWLRSSDVSGPANVLGSLCNMAGVVLLVIAILYFLRFIRNINRLEIFTWGNVSLLKKIGRMLIFSFLLNLVYSWLTCWSVSEVFSVEGRMLDWVSPMISNSSIIIGVAALIMGEVFTIGLRLREEQELTI